MNGRQNLFFCAAKTINVMLQPGIPTRQWCKQENKKKETRKFMMRWVAICAHPFNNVMASSGNRFDLFRRTVYFFVRARYMEFNRIFTF